MPLLAVQQQVGGLEYRLVENVALRQLAHAMAHKRQDPAILCGDEREGRQADGLTTSPLPPRLKALVSRHAVPSKRSMPKSPRKPKCYRRWQCSTLARSSRRSARRGASASRRLRVADMEDHLLRDLPAVMSTDTLGEGGPVGGGSDDLVQFARKMSELGQVLQVKQSLGSPGPLAAVQEKRRLSQAVKVYRRPVLTVT